MLNQIEFTINRTELIKTLRFLSPFIVPQEKEFEDDDEEESEIVLPEPYFYDKVTFMLCKSQAYLSVLTIEGVEVERTCGVSSNVQNVSFCIPHAYLLQEVEKVRNEAESYTFKEDRFFGFNVFDAYSDCHLFDVDAHSVSKQTFVVNKNLFPHILNIEQETLLSALKDFPKYTANFFSRDCRDYRDYIWFYVKDGFCRIVASSGSLLRQEVFHTRERGSYVFSLPGKFASRLYDIIKHWSDSTKRQIEYNGNYLRLIKFYMTGGYGETIELPMCKSRLPDVEIFLKNKRNITYRSSVRLSELQSALRMINTMRHKKDYVLLHFFKNHVNIYNESYDYQTVFHFLDAEGVNCECTIKLLQEKFEAILNEINTDKVVFTLVDDWLLYISNENEPMFGYVVRILVTAKMDDDDLKLIERGDSSLNSHEEYNNKYISELDVQEELEEEDESEEDSNEDYASNDEMKEEALRRMKEVIEYTDIIDDFEETGLPQVYEPPYGASYSLEDDELESVRNIENYRNVLVWGVVRSMMLYDGENVTVDNMLHVSRNKKEWEQEREDLRNGTPFVYTVMKEHDVPDHGYINVYKSEGGTLLRKLL